MYKQKINDSILNSLYLQEKESRKEAFTLVELIVVITILAILGTIAFISLEGYSREARDSTRISDISTMKTSLELFELSTGKYPTPDNGNTVSYSGETLWTQGIFGENVVKNLSRSLSEVPKDPLTDLNYIYSVTNTKSEYEILGLFEGSDLTNINTINTTNAADKKVYPKITGNYNGVFVKSPNYIVPTPSIINAEVGEVELILNATNIKSQILTGYDNVLKVGTINAQTGALDISLSAYEGTVDKNTSDTEKELVIQAIQNAYSGSNIENEPQIEYVLEKTTSEELTDLFDVIVLNNAGSSSSSSSTTTNTSPQTYQEMGLCNEPDITVGGITIAACNLGTTTAATSYNDSAGYGHYFQFGRNTSYEDGTWTNGNSSYNYDWLSPGGTDAGSANLWGVGESEKTTATYSNQNSSDQALMQLPCPDGYHVPTNKEWSDLISAALVTDQTTAYNNLKLPSAGYRNGISAVLSEDGSRGHYWSSSPDGIYGYTLYFYYNNIISTYSYRSYGRSLRCFKD